MSEQRTICHVIGDMAVRFKEGYAQISREEWETMLKALTDAQQLAVRQATLLRSRK